MNIDLGPVSRWKDEFSFQLPVSGVFEAKDEVCFDVRSEFGNEFAGLLVETAQNPDVLGRDNVGAVLVAASGRGGDADQVDADGIGDECGADGGGSRLLHFRLELLAGRV